MGRTLLEKLPELTKQTNAATHSVSSPYTVIFLIRYD